MKVYVILLSLKCGHWHFCLKAILLKAIYNIYVLSDVDECVYDVCPDHANCLNTDGDYTCKCDSGLVNIGGKCEGTCTSIAHTYLYCPPIKAWSSNYM